MKPQEYFRNSPEVHQGYLDADLLDGWGEMCSKAELTFIVGTESC